MPHIEYRPQADLDPHSGSYELPARDLSIPQEILDHYGAAVLDPSKVPLDEDEVRPSATVYRTDVLLVPAQILDAEGRSWINNALMTIGLELKDREHLPHSNDEVTQWRTVVLKVAKGARNVVVDAWLALRALRRALAGVSDPGLREKYAKIGLDHLLVGSAFAGVGGGDIGGQPATSGHGWTDRGPAAAPVGGYARMPVTVVAGPPYRRPAQAIGGRRPVLVIPDTGVPESRHSWFQPVHAPDSFMYISNQAQTAVEENVQGVSGGTRVRAGQFSTHVEDIGPPNPLLGTLNSHLGHGLMQAGLVCQIAPDARVLMLKVMRADGVVPESALQAAIHHALKRIDQGEFVDVFTFACGYFHETEAHELLTPALVENINKLRERGVVVVAAAGNHATTRPFWPAAMALISSDPQLAPMLAVGARNPDGTVAIFSNEFAAVEWFADGAAVVSTFPPGVRGAEAAPLQPVGAKPPGRASFDGDNYGEFAGWSGSSFAVPVLGATVMQLMIEEYQLLELSATDTQRAVNRARAVVEMLMKGRTPQIVPV